MNNEKDIFSKLVEKAKTTALSEREKSALFSSVDSFVKKNPISSPVHLPGSLPSQEESIISTWFNIFDFKAFSSPWYSHGMRSFAVVVVVMVFGIGGTSLAAQNSLPGDFLYPVMVNLNEGIKVALLTGSAKAEYEVQRVKNRVDEIKQLAAEDRLSPEARTVVATRLNSHVSRLQKDVDSLTEKGEFKVALDITTELEDSLKSDELASFEAIVSAPLETSVIARENTENKILALSENEADAHEIKAIAEAKFQSAKLALENLETDVGVGVMSATMAAPMATGLSVAVEADTLDVNAKSKTSSKELSEPIQEISQNTGLMELVEVRTLFSLGEDKLSSQNYVEAFAYFKQAYDLAQDIKDAQEKAKKDAQDVLNNDVRFNDLESGDGDIKTKETSQNSNSSKKESVVAESKSTQPQKVENQSAQVIKNILND